MFQILTEEQEELRSLVADFLATTSDESEVRRLMATPEGFDQKTWTQMAEEVGLQGIAIPEEYGGQGFSWVELGIVLEEMGKNLHCSPFFSTVVLAGSALQESGDEALKQARLPEIATGQAIATLAFPGENREWTLAGVTIQAVETPTGWLLTGAAPEVIDGSTADYFVVPAQTNQGVQLFVVDRGTGVTVQGLETLDQTRKIARVQFEGASGIAFRSDISGEELLTRVLDLAAVGLAAEQAGGARAALDTSVDYLKTRVQFGQIIGQFQALKHMAADVLVEVESATSAAQNAAFAAAHNRDQLPVAASLAAAFCTDAFVAAAHQNIQFHGGMGFTWEMSPHLYFKRARADEVLLGDAQYHRANLAKRMGL